MKKATIVITVLLLPVLLAGETIPYGIPYKPGTSKPVTTAQAAIPDGLEEAPRDFPAETHSTATETDVVDEKSSAENTVQTPPAPTISAAYSRSDFDGVVIAVDKSWYLEEADSLGRPFTGTLWKDGSIVKVTSWQYYGNSQRAEKKIETTSDQSTETDYDKSGNVVLVEITSSKGEVVSRLENVWNEKGLLSSSVFRKDKSVIRTEYEYANSGSKDDLTVKKLFKNDELVSRCDYSEEDSWVETVFSKGKAILAVDYVKGERQGKHDEKKF